MKVLFVEARKKTGNGEIRLQLIPRKIHLLYTAQYKNLAGKIRKQLEKSGREIVAFQQVLGCSKIKPRAALLFIGSGRFHALQIALSTDKEVYLFSDKTNKISREEIEKGKKVEKGKTIRFLASESIGLLFSTKPGQNKLKEAIRLKKMLKNKFPEKKFYIFISDNINIQELENFPCFFINTACSGLALDSKKIINYENLKYLLKNN